MVAGTEAGAAVVECEPPRTSAERERPDGVPPTPDDGGVAAAVAALRSAFERAPVAISLLVSLGVFAVFAVVARPAFETDDDVAMMFIANGRLYGEPTSDLVYTNALVGEALGWLYRTAGAVEWYPLYLYTLHVTSLAIVVYLVLGRPALWSRSRVGLAAVLVSAVCLHAWMNLQFTSTAMMLAFAAAALHAFGPRSMPWGLTAVAGVLVGVASLVRLEATVLAVALFAPVLIALARRKTVRQHVLFGALAAATVLGGFAYQQARYPSGSEWADFYAYNSARGSIHDTPRVDGFDSAADAIDDVGWSVNDAELFRMWYLFDDEVYSTERLERLGEQLPLDRTGALSDLASLVSLQLGSLLAVAGIAGYSAVRLSARHAVLVGATATLAAVVCGYLLVTLKLPMRLTLPTVFWLGLVMILLFEPARAPTSRVARSFGRACYAVAVVAGVGTLLWSIAVTGPDNSRRADELAATVEAVEGFDENGRFVLSTGAIELGDYPPLHAPSVGDPELIVSGAFVQSPSHDAHLASLGVTDLYRGIADEEDLYLLVRGTESGLTERINRFIAEHYDDAPSVGPVAELGEGGLVVVSGAGP